MKSMKIKGKDYFPVNERIKYFRSEAKYEDWAMLSEIVSMDDTSVCIKATIYNPDGLPKATGIAQEFRSSSNINKTSFVENCETSAFGRALGNLGIGIDESMASADELANALERQEALNKVIDKNAVDALKAKMLMKGVDEDKICSAYGIYKLEELTEDQWLNAMRRLDNN